MIGYVTDLLNKRFEKASVNANILKVLDVNDPVEIVEIIQGDPFENSDVWYKLKDGSFVWSGAVKISGSENYTEVINNKFSLDSLADEWIKAIGYNKKEIEDLLPLIGEVFINDNKKGSCFYLTNNIAISCWHLFEESRKNITANFSGDFIPFSIKPKELDAISDLAILRTKENIQSNMSSIPKGSDDSIIEGTPVCNVGFPGGSENKRISFGRILAPSNNDFSHSCHSVGGNSGGAIINLETKKLIGIHKGEFPIGSDKRIFKSIYEIELFLNKFKIKI